MAIIAVSDIHLGYEYADRESFNGFLDDLMKDATVTDLVLLGDVVDMWRRDASGVFLENRDTFDRLAALKERMNVHYVSGNHDYHTLQLKNHHYPFAFRPDLLLAGEKEKYRFVHGHQFDDQQHEPLMEALCRTLSDAAGDFESGVWAMLTRDWSDLEYFISALFRKRGYRQKTEALQQAPEKRLAATLGSVEKKAFDDAAAHPGTILVFGHTHVPFINKTGTVVNTGCWVKDAPVSNTYVRLDADGPRLFVYRGEEITARL